jgi:hypothetical protein
MNLFPTLLALMWQLVSGKDFECMLSIHTQPLHFNVFLGTSRFILLPVIFLLKVVYNFLSFLFFWTQVTIRFFSLSIFFGSREFKGLFPSHFFGSRQFKIYAPSHFLGLKVLYIFFFFLFFWAQVSWRIFYLPIILGG